MWLSFHDDRWCHGDRWCRGVGLLDLLVRSLFVVVRGYEGAMSLREAQRSQVYFVEDRWWEWGFLGEDRLRCSHTGWYEALV